MKAQKAPREVEADTPEQALHRVLNFFPTPPWATRAGAEILQGLDPGARVIREPACGQMHMAGPLADYFPEVIASDIHPYSPETPLRDWMEDAAWPAEPDCDWIFCNPPFSLAEEFVVRGLRRARRGVALLVRVQFLEGATRYERLYQNHPLTLFAPFVERVPMHLGRYLPGGDTATGYGWFFWMRDVPPRPIHFIPPGTRDRLVRRDDAGRYGFKEPMSLFAAALVDEAI